MTKLLLPLILVLLCASPAATHAESTWPDLRPFTATFSFYPTPTTEQQAWLLGQDHGPSPEMNAETGGDRFNWTSEPPYYYSTFTVREHDKLDPFLAGVRRTGKLQVDGFGLLGEPIRVRTTLDGPTVTARVEIDEFGNILCRLGVGLDAVDLDPNKPEPQPPSWRVTYRPRSGETMVIWNPDACFRESYALLLVTIDPDKAPV